MRSIIIVQRVLPHYRRELFSRMEAALCERGLKLTVIYGRELPGETPASVHSGAAWAREVRNIYLSRGRLVWQPWVPDFSSADLIVVEHAGRSLLSVVLALRAWIVPGRKPVLAFWGHGKNFRRSNIVAEVFKRFLARKAYWWFAYTELSAEIVRGYGIPAKRITILNNTIDTTELKRAIEEVDEKSMLNLRHELRLTGTNICIYSGGLYEAKCLPFLIEACKRIRSEISDFEIIFVGDGPKRNVVMAACKDYPWMKFVGSKHGREIAPYYRLSKLLLMPGLVGLAIVDSFVASVPIVTTNLPIHSPEIAYLKRGENGICTHHDVNSFADAVINALNNQSLLLRLVSGCRAAAELYSIEKMVDAFVRGVESCLAIHSHEEDNSHS